MNLPRRPRLAATLALTLLLAGSCLSAQAASGKIRTINFDPASRTFQIDSSLPVRADMNILSIAGRQRIIIDLENAELGTGLPRDVQLVRQLSQSMPGLRNLTTHQYGGAGSPMVRILLDMDGTAPPLRLVRSQGEHIELLMSKRINGVEPTAATSNRIQPNSTPRSAWFPPNSGPMQIESPAKKTSMATSPAAMPDWRNSRPVQATLKPYPSTPYSPSKPYSSQPAPTKAAETPQPTSNPKPVTAAEVSDTDELKRALVNLNQRYIQLLDTNKQLQTQNQSLQAQQSQASDQQNQQLAKLQEENQKLAQQNQQLESRNKRGADAKNDSQKLHALQQENSQLAQQLKALQDGSSKAQSSQTRQVDNLQAENQRLSQQLASMQDSASKRGEQDKTIQTLKQDNAVLNQQLTALRGQGSQSQTLAQEQMKRLQDENARLSQQMETIRLNADKSSKQATSTAEQAVKRLQDENSQLSKENKNLQARVAKRDEKTSRAQDSQSQQLTAQNKQLSEQLEALRAKDQQNEQAQQSKADLQKQLQSAQTENQSLRSQLADTKKSTPSPSTVAPSELTSMRKQVTVAQASLNEAIKTINEQNKEVAFLRSQMADVKNGTDGALRQQLERQQTEISEKNTKIQTLESQNNELKKSGTKAVTSKAGGSGATVQQELAGLRQKLAESQQQNTDLKNQLAKVGSTAMPNGTDSIPLDTNSGTNTLQNAERHYQSGRSALANKNTTQALSEFQEASNLAPNNGRYVIDYANMLAETQQVPTAVTTLTNYLGKNPVDREAYTQLGKLYLMNDQPEPAVQAFNRALPVSTLNNYASALKKTNRIQDAESVFKLALTLNPKDSEVLFNLGNLYNTTEKTTVARDYYQKALQSRPNFPEAHYNLGLIYAKLGDKTQAISHLEQFLKLSPQTKNADTIKAYIEKLKT